MHLKQLKLAGFKSFVDPTVVPFPSQLLAVVGPNGCGKSNIIDAVRWVMGESSAKNLRGESMTDVIFNGSSNRKPVGQASVELIFDNSLGRLTGPFASYGEIAVKRIVTRDGDSAYFLNGSRCRRKDITDIFLGTGAGSRGYSIIGQGTISRLIEAKPEELRIFLEEAAGVSKYKERRRETLQRIAHTQENLTRVADIRDELDKQLQRLERQAKAAERYTHLKAEEQLCRAQIVALKWQDFTHQQVQKQHELQELALQYEQQQSNLTHAHSERTQLNEQLHEANDQAQSIQTIFYQLGSEIARLEETIQQHEKEKKRLEHDKQQMQHDWQKAEEQLKQDEEALQNCQQYAHDWQEKLARLQHEFNQQELLLLEQQQQKNLCETAWQESQNKIIDLKSELQIAQVQGDYLEQRRQQIVMRIDKLTTEHQSIAIDDLQSLQIQLNEKQVKLIETQFFDETQLKQSNELCNQQKGHLQDIEQHLHQAQDDFHRLNSEYAALSAAQKAAKQSHQGQELIQWSDKAKLMDVLRVEAPWQAVCEMVLHEELHAYVLDDLQDLWPQWAIFLGAAASVVTMTTPTDRSSRPRLADKIEGCVPHTRQALEHIFIAAHLDEAISWLPELNDYESVVTAEGFWLGKGWVKLASKAEHDEMGLLARAQKISELKVQVNQLQENI
ncbi:MAG: chromosome segregation protein SMC, partial [bacterium]|nr:chromosome segregation protein SMC [bacterium]